MSDPASPVFIVGSPRTGSSVLHWALCQSPTLWGSSESDFLHDLAPAVVKAWDRGVQQGEYSWLVKERVSENEFFTRIGGAIDELFRSRSGGLRWIDQTPYYVHITSALLRVFPDAVFLVLFRDGRQATPSIQSLLGYDFPRAVQEWSEATERAISLMENRPLRCHPVVYEDLILNTRDCLTRVYEFLGEPFREESVHFVRERDPINTSFQRESSLDKLRPRWHAWTWLMRRTFDRQSRNLLERLGYETDKSWISKPHAAGEGGLERTVERVVGKLEAIASDQSPVPGT